MSKERTGLNDETFDAIVFNTFNMPSLHEINFAPIIKKWFAAGRNKGTTNDGDASTASKVIRRHLGNTTPTFLFK